VHRSRKIEVILETERLKLRRPKVGDASNLLRLLSDPTFASAVPEIPRVKPEVEQYLSVEASVTRPEPDTCFNLLIERRSDGVVVGLTTLVLRKHGQGELGYALHTDFRGLGYATEAARSFMKYAFAELRLHRIYASTRADNTASWKVMERLHMTPEARFREMVLEDGDWRDVVVYAMLAKDWPIP
jgi:RimJ/RimL family protein N-acetyltransferase